MEFLQTNPLLYAGLRQVLRRGTAEVLEQSGQGVFLQDRPSGVYMLAAATPELGAQWLRRHEARGYPLLMLFLPELRAFAEARYGFTHRMDCLQAVYTQPEPPAVRPRLQIRPAQEADLPLITAHYKLLREQDILEVIRNSSLYLAFREGVPAGFAGLHLEGSMGLLEIFPPYRRQGYAAELESRIIASCLREGAIPYCQVEIGNENSLRLQRKLGLTLAEGPVYWLF